MKLIEFHSFKDNSLLNISHDDGDYDIAPKLFLFLGLDWYAGSEIPLRKRPDRVYYRFFSATISLMRYRFNVNVRLNKLSYTNYEQWKEQRLARFKPK
jgi:hypothetical protein